MKPTQAQIEALRRECSQTLGAVCLPSKEMVALLNEIERLTAAAEIGDDQKGEWVSDKEWWGEPAPPAGKGPWVSSECMNNERNATIERCAQICADHGSTLGNYFAAAIRKLKEGK